MKNQRARRLAGFTLIELLVVIAIIGVLASTILASVNTARAKARDARRSADIHSVQLALESYYNTNNVYPPARNIVGTALADGTTSVLATTTAIDLVGYLTSNPNDPFYGGSSNYQYVRKQNPDGYGIRVRYEVRSGTDASGYCKWGVNINSGWWGSGTPNCQQ